MTRFNYSVSDDLRLALGLDAVEEEEMAWKYRCDVAVAISIRERVFCVRSAEQRSGSGQDEAGSWINCLDTDETADPAEVGGDGCV